MMYPSRI